MCAIIKSTIKNHLLHRRERINVEKTLIDRLDKIIKQQDKLISIWQNFLRGVIYGFGVFVGSALLVALLIYILSFFITAPVIGEWLAHIVDIIKSHNVR